MRTLVPPPAPRGGHLRVVAPAGALNAEVIEPAVVGLRERGFCVSMGRHVFDGCDDAPYLSAPDELRAQDLVTALLEEDVDAVVCARGGYGCTRLLADLEAELDRRGKLRPRLVTGFSDVTALLCHLRFVHGVASIHGPLLSTISARPRTGGDRAPFVQQLSALAEALQGRPCVHLDQLETLLPGTAEGTLIVGNLTLLTGLVGTAHLPSLEGVILLIEDVGEAAYRLDRMLTNLALGGHLNGLGALVLGDLGGTGDRWVASADFDRCVRQRVTELLSPLKIPVAANAPVGHGDRNVPVPFGTRAVLDATNGTLHIGWST